MSGFEGFVIHCASCNRRWVVLASVAFGTNG
ncbi:MAG: hypothetical protein ACOVLE_06775 [Pirellula staleyi]